MIVQEIFDLLDNPAFWTFLGIVVSGYFGYKGIMAKSPAAQKKKVQNASSFEELKEVVILLQHELERKDKRYRKDLESYERRLTGIQTELDELILERQQMIRLMRQNGLVWPPNDDII